MGLTPETLVARLGDYLVERGTISAENLQAALILQQKTRDSGKQAPLLGQILISMGVINREILDQAVTEQILQLRGALENYNKFLEKRVQERTAELELALSRLSELNQLKSNLVANISHELRTPLTHIKGYIELLISEGLGPLTSDQEQALEVMENSTDRLERLIEDLLLFSMAEKDQIILHIRPVNLPKLCKDLLNRAGDSASMRNIKLRLDCSIEPLIIEGDEEKIAWAISQLLDNAIKFTSPGGNAEIKIEVEGKFATLAVIDTGIGIPSEKFSEIFESFHQLDGSSTRRYGGTGLGLSLVKKIVEAHGSVIHVASEIEHGSTFTFLLKLAEDH
ncbi:MAG: ATP-binding protein [Anaerolineaceae bacterium]|jgi:signal transduction histidine kinase